MFPLVSKTTSSFTPDISICVEETICMGSISVLLYKSSRNDITAALSCSKLRFPAAASVAIDAILLQNPPSSATALVLATASKFLVPDVVLIVMG